jgi:hypothetical protein
MTALLLFFRFLEALFLIGVVGSLVVVVITTVEDFAVLFERDKPAPGIETTERAENELAHAQ